MDKFKVTMLPEPTLVKPITVEEKLQWANALGSSPTIDLTIEELATAAGKWRHSFCHAVFNNQWIHRDNFQYTQLIVVDIDKNLTPQQALDRSKELGLPMPNIIYLTLSDPTDSTLPVDEKLNQAKRFRMIYALDKPVYDLRIYEALIKQGMYIIFPESDHVGATQKWLGGKDVILLNTDTRLHIDNMMCAADVYDSRNIKTTQGRKKRYIKKYDNLPPNIFQNGGWGDDGHDIVSSSANSLYKYKGLVGNGTIRNFDWAQAALEFKLLDSFLNCKRKISNPELMGLFSGMRRIEGGRKLWRDSIKNNLDIDNRHLDIEDWYNSVLAKGRNPWERKIREYAPTDPAGLKYDRLTDIQFKQGRPAIKLKSIPEFKLKEAEMKMNTFIKKALTSLDKGTFILKGATAIGKTEQFVQNDLTGCVYAVPNHSLKDEIANRMKLAGKVVNGIPDIPDLPYQIQNELDKIRKAGDHIGAARYLRRMAQGFRGLDFGLSGQEANDLQKKLKEYFAILSTCLNSEIPVITTHKRVLFTDFPNHHTLIIDEDIIPILIEFGSFTSRDLRRLINSQCSGNLKDLATLKSLLRDIELNNKMNRHVQNTVQGKNEIFEDYQDISNCLHRISKSQDGQIIPFFDCDHYLVENIDNTDPQGDKIVYYVKRRKMPSDKKIIMLSATANESMCRNIFSVTDWIDLSHIEHVGTRIQYSDISFSQSSLSAKSNRKAINRIINHIGSLPVITFKKYRHIFKNPAEMYFGNCSGFDQFKGIDIAVVGTPHVPTYVYRLMAVAMGIEFKAVDFNLDTIWVEYNGYKFRFMTYAHLGLRSIQFYFIESELIQACGRTRSLRKDSSCQLFSNFPLGGFEQRSTKEFHYNTKIKSYSSKTESHEVLELNLTSGSLE